MIIFNRSMFQEKRLSVARLQKQMKRELHHMSSKRGFSLASLPTEKSLRVSASKSVKSIFLQNSSRSHKNNSVVERPSSPISKKSSVKLARSQDIGLLNKPQNRNGKLKKKRSNGFDKQFTTLSRKKSQPTQVDSLPSQGNSISEEEYDKVLSQNIQYEKKISQQKSLIDKLESIIEEMAA